MKNSTSFRNALLSMAAGVALLISLTLVPAGASQAQNGINSDGTDFFVSVMPGIVHGAYFSTGSAAAYYLVCSYENNNQISIEYIGGPGPGPWPTKQYIVNKGIGREIPVDPASAVPDRPGEQLQYRAAHIFSKYPISVQVYSEGSSNGTMYQAIPTAGLGKSYVVAAYNDNPLDDNPGYVNRDSSSSDFMIIAPYDHTHVTYTPNSTTQALGTVGVNSGPMSNGTPHPVTIELQRGEVYWVRSSAVDVAQDESGSTVVADKPIAVLGGEERAMIGYPSGYWTTLDNDIRNQVGEEMTPAVDWGTDYPSIPTMPASISDVTIVGDGDMYRVFTNDPNGMAMNYWQNDAAPYAKYGPNYLSIFALPATEFDNVTNPIDLMTAANSQDASGNLKKFYGVQYLYFQGHHDFDPNRRIGGKGATPQSGGGDQTLDETSYRCEEEMDLVPINHWKTSAIFMVPPNSAYNGYQFINVITYKDSLRDIMITRNNASTGSLGSFIPPTRTYQIPQHPELVGLTIKVPTGTYVINGNTPLVCYSYGRTETRYKDIFGYAAPCGQAYGSHEQPNPPKAEVTPSCGQWNVRIHEGGNGGGIAEVMLLNDPNGYIAKPPQVSYNCSLIGNGTDPQNIMSPPFIVGDTSILFTVQVSDPSKDAFAAVYAVDLSGNDTEILLRYTAPAITLSATKAVLPATMVTSQQCSSLTFHVTSTGSLDSIETAYSLLSNGGSFAVTTIPQLPATLRQGDSVIFDFCATPQDTNGHIDSLQVIAGCITDTLYMQDKGLTPIIVADDHDFGSVTVGNTVCADIKVKNIGNAPLIIDSNYHLFNNPDYTFSGTVPDTIQPGGTYQFLHFCFRPSHTGTDNSRMDWGNNTTGIYAHHNKDTSALLGYGQAPGLSWKWHNQQFTVECTDTQVVRVLLENTSSGQEGADLTVNNISLIGQDAKDWSIIDIRGNGTAGSGISTPFTLQKGDTTSTWVDLLFKPNPLVDGFNDRLAGVVASGQSLSANNQQYHDTLNCVGVVRNAVVTINPPTYGFGSLKPGQTATATFTITNTGDTAFIISGLSSSDPSFSVISGPGNGDTLAPGMTDTITVRYIAIQGGGVSIGNLMATGDHMQCNQPLSIMKAVSTIAQVAETPTNYPVTYVCHNDSSFVTAKNTGTVGVILDTVEILDDPNAGAAASQFKFATTDTQYVAVNTNIEADSTVSFPIIYTPAVLGNVSAIAVFHWEDTSVRPAQIHLDTQIITGSGYEAKNAVQLTNLAAPATPYSAVTATTVTMPIHLGQHFDTIAQIYGVQFTLRYNRDEFNDPKVAANPNIPGLTLASTPQATVDPNDNTYELLPIHFTCSSPIIDSNLGTVTWEYVVAKDSTTPVKIQDLMFLDTTGASACWVGASTAGSNFYGLNTCGDATLRNFLKGGLPVLSIGEVVPNPAGQSAVVSFNVAQNGTPVTMRLYNALGESVETVMEGQSYDKGAHLAALDASKLPSGIYTIYLSTAGYGTAKQILVTR